MSQGRFIWYELGTKDLDAATRFYTAVVGWKTKNAGQPDMRYEVLNPPSTPDGMGIGGMMQYPPQMAANAPQWNGYVSVDDVDAFAARVTKHGGAICQPPTDIPNVGRFAFVNDPQGASFYLFKPNGATQAPPPPDITPGYVGWRELVTSDWKAAFTFYSELFGWAKGGAVEMGAVHGTYQLFSSGEGQMSGMMNNGAVGGGPPMWRYYFSVPSVAAAAERVKAEGGTIVTPPHEVPGGGWISTGTDPQGGSFAVTGPK